jgi:hypothetical protein
MPLKTAGITPSNMAKKVTMKLPAMNGNNPNAP